MEQANLQKPKEMGSIVLGGDFTLALFAGFIYYAKAAFEGGIPVFSTPGLLIWLNLVRVLLLYFYCSRKKPSINAISNLFIASNLTFLPLLEIATPSNGGDYHLLYFLLVLFSVFRLDPQKTLIVSIAALLSHWAASIFEQHFSIWRSVVSFGYFGLVYLFLRVFISKFKASQVKLTSALDVLNRRTWELEMAHSETEMIYNTVADIAGTIDTKEFALKILIITTRWLGAKTCKVYRVSAEGRHLLLIGEADLESSKTYETPPKISITECLSFLDGDALSREDAPVNYLERGLLNSEDRTVMFSPLVARGKAIGGILTESSSDRGFSESDERRFMALASSASMALDNAQLLKKTEELAIVDELTGMYNYRFFRDKLNTEIQRAIRYKHKLSILMIDIDFFKKINDNHGHEAGNLILQQLAGLLRRCVREVDILSRYGGEEFVVILPQTGVGEAKMVGERIRDEVERTVFECGPEAPEVRLTVSVGVESFSEAYVKNTDLFLKQADQHLYAAKEAGRNRVVCGQLGKPAEIEPVPVQAASLAS